MVVSLNRGTPKSSVLGSDFPWNKLTVLEYPQLRTPPCFHLVIANLPNSTDLDLISQLADVTLGLTTCSWRKSSGLGGWLEHGSTVCIPWFYMIFWWLCIENMRCLGNPPRCSSALKPGDPQVQGIQSLGSLLWVSKLSPACFLGKICRESMCLMSFDPEI